MAKRDKLPDVVYVKREIEGDESYLVLNEEAEELLNLGDEDSVGVGTYALTGTRKLRLETVLVENGK